MKDKWAGWLVLLAFVLHGITYGIAHRYPERMLGGIGGKATVVLVSPVKNQRDTNGNYHLVDSRAKLVEVVNVTNAWDLKNNITLLGVIPVLEVLSFVSFCCGIYYLLFNRFAYDI